MDRRKILLALLVAWVLLVSAAGIYRLVALGKLTGNEGPQALARDGNGGIYLATSGELLHLDADGNVQERRSAQALGLKEINTVATGEAGVLWLYDSAMRHLFRCSTPGLNCISTTTATSGLDKNVALAWLHGPRQLLLTDNAHHRLLTLDENGKVIHGSGKVWHYPNQILSNAGLLFLADSDSRQILQLDADGNRSSLALQTRERPYRFVRRDKEWWVIEAGVSLLKGRLRHYQGEAMEKIELPVSDPVDLLDTGRQILIASRADWQLLALNPDSGSLLPYGSPALQQEFRQHENAGLDARRERSRLPFLMLALMAPALLGGVVLQRRIDHSKSLQSDTQTGSTSSTALVTGSVPVAATRPRTLRIDTDRSALEAQRARQNHVLMRTGLLMLPLAAIIVLMLFLVPEPLATAVRLLAIMMLLLPALVVLMLYLGRRKQDRLYDQHFLCGPDKLVHVVQGKPRRAVPYTAIWLGTESLVFGKERMPLYTGVGQYRSALWAVSDVQREIGARIPATQNMASDLELGRELIKQDMMMGLRIVAARYALVIVVAGLVLLKAWNIIQHFWGVKLWQIMH